MGTGGTAGIRTGMGDGIGTAARIRRG